MEDIFKAAARLIADADSILICAGAGIGVDSGLPDFRGNEGFWRAYPALAEGNIQFTDIANGMAFVVNPRRGWGFYGHRLNLYRKIIPHDGFRILQEIAAPKLHDAFVFTSNVDGQFQKSGFADDRIVECHGSIHNLQCVTPCSETIWSADNLSVAVDEVNCQLTSGLPRCPHCSNVLRPNILMFSDSAWIETRAYQQQDLLDAWLRKVQNPVVIEIGAGKAIPTVRRMGEALKCPLIRINVRESDIGSKTGVSIPYGALESLQKIQAALQ